MHLGCMVLILPCNHHTMYVCVYLYRPKKKFRIRIRVIPSNIKHLHNSNSERPLKPPIPCIETLSKHVTFKRLLMNYIARSAR